MQNVLRALLAPFFLWLSMLAAPALDVTLTPADPIASFSFPSGWTVTDTRRGIEVKSPDEEVFVWFEVYAPDEYATLVREHEEYFKRQGVMIRGAPRVAEDTGKNHAVKASDFPATWKGRPTVLRYLAYDLHLASGKQILMTYWASPEGDRAHDKTMKGIIGSMKLAK